MGIVFFLYYQLQLVLIQHTVRIWLTLLHSVKSTANWLVDIGHDEKVTFNMPYWHLLQFPSLQVFATRVFCDRKGTTKDLQ